MFVWYISLDFVSFLMQWLIVKSLSDTVIPFFCNKNTLQEMCCGFLLSREMWYRKSVLPGTGAG